MACEPRDVATLLDHIRSIGPGFRDTDADLAVALDTVTATIMAEIEAAIHTLHARTFILEADGDYLDEHGQERSVPRLQDEIDDDYVHRVKLIEEKLTRPAILAHVDAILAVGTASMEEWLPDGAFTDILAIQGFTETSHTHGGIRGFTVYIEPQIEATADRGFALDEPADPFEAPEDVFHTFAGTDAEPTVSAFADGTDLTPSSIYPTIWNEIDRLRAGGLGPFPHFRVEVA